MRIEELAPSHAERQQKSLLIKPEDIPDLLGKIADLIAERATRRMRRELLLARA